MTSYDDFLSRLLSEVPGCPEIAAIQALKDTTIDFCEKSLIHQVDHDPISVVAKIPDYDIESPVTQTRIMRIMRAWYLGNELDPISPDYVNDPSIYNQHIGGDYEVRYSQPQGYIQKDTATISLYPIPDKTVTNAITMRVALVPLRSSTSCADFLFEQHVEDISAGAAARLQSSPGKTYTNMQVAAVNQKRYISGVNDARMRSNRGFTRANMQVKLRRI
jgi:hypothetical protein